MMVIRDVFRAKYGRGDELVELFREGFGFLPGMADHGRILTDASGAFFQVITEVEVENLATWERMVAEEMAREQFAAWFARMVEITESGQREFYHVAYDPRHSARAETPAGG